MNVILIALGCVLMALGVVMLANRSGYLYFVVGPRSILVLAALLRRDLAMAAELLWVLWVQWAPLHLHLHRIDICP